MTPIETALELVIKVARQNKEGQASGGPYGTEMPTTLMMFRGTEHVATVIPEGGPDRDKMIRCASLAASGFSADILGLAFETFLTKYRCNPRTNRRWGPNEMQDLATNHEGREKGWVIDAVQVMAYNRAGDCRGRNMAYRVVDDGVQWDDAYLPPDDVYEFVGVVHDHLVRIMAMQTLPQFLAAQGDELDGDPEETQTRMDIMMAQALIGRYSPLVEQLNLIKLTRAHVMLSAELGSRRAEMLAEADALLGDGTS